MHFCHPEVNDVIRNGLVDKVYIAIVQLTESLRIISDQVANGSVFCIPWRKNTHTKFIPITFSISVLASLMCEIMRLDLSMLPWKTQGKIVIVNR